MITIVRGHEKIVCTQKTYEEQYKQLGYLPASEGNKEATKKVASSLKEEKNEEEKITEKYGVKRRTSTKKGK